MFGEISRLPFFEGGPRPILLFWQTDTIPNSDVTEEVGVELEGAAEALLGPLGYEVLELTVTGKGKKRSVLLRIDRLDGGVVTMEDVETATGVFSLELDRLDPFEGEYNLEVESPGPERPLKTAEHFRRFSGLLAKVRAHGETFTGRVKEVNGERVTFDIKGQTRDLSLAEIQARLAEWPDTPR